MYVQKRTSRYLTPTERVKIEAWYKLGRSQAWIAAQLGVARSTICRELRHGLVDQLNGDTWQVYQTYSAQKAEAYHKWVQSARGGDLKIGTNAAYLEAIQERVLDNYSFEEAISAVAETGAFDVRISKQTAYRYLNLQLFSRLTYAHLPIGHRKKGRGRVRRVNLTHPDHRSIEQRLTDVKERREVGHWEMDSIIGKAKGSGESCLVLTERKTRQEIILKPKGKTAADTVAALNGLRKAFGKDWNAIFKTITCDNGSEFADQKGMETDATLFFYCHPQSPGERGSNENTNKLIRRKLPKGKSLAGVTARKAHTVQQWVNHFHRPILGGRCSNDVFLEEMEKLPLHDLERVRRFFP